MRPPERRLILPLALVCCVETKEHGESAELGDTASCSPLTFYYDGDGDGYGVESDTATGCEAAVSYVELSGDCDDADAETYPGAPEDRCTEPTDRDCDGQVEPEDVDGDGWDECLDCDDADGGVGPNQVEICDDGVDQDCSGLDVLCGIWSDAGLGSSALRLEGDGDSWGAGFAARFVGDTNGDGRADLLVGASQASLGAPLGGAAYLLTDTYDGDHVLGETATASLAAIGYYDHLGFSAAALGDPDGDGFSDVAIGAPLVDGATEDTGVAYVLFGPWVGLVSAAEADAALRGDAPGGGYAGYALDNAGDVDGDGVEDAIVGAPKVDGSDSRAGEAYVDFGPPAETSLYDADVVIAPETAHGMLGLRVAGVGDMDGDGLSEVALGWPETDLWSPEGGAVIVVSCPSAGTLVVPDAGVALMDDEVGGTEVGQDVGPAGDVNADGYADVLVGQRNPVAGYASAGAVYVVLGPLTAHAGLSSAESRLLGTASAEWAELGAGDGDLDADGHVDLVVGAWGDRSLGHPGTVYVLYGPVSAGTTSLDAADVKLRGESDDDEAGYVVAIDGDLNQDGYSDLAVGAPGVDVSASGEGAVYLLYGGPPP